MNEPTNIEFNSIFIPLNVTLRELTLHILFNKQHIYFVNM